jgi:S1-C subfamily serine protease
VNDSVLIRALGPTSLEKEVLKNRDVIVSFDGVPVANEGIVPFHSKERIAFGFPISQRFTGDTTELGIIREGKKMNVLTTLKPRVHLVQIWCLFFCINC